MSTRISLTGTVLIFAQRWDRSHFLENLSGLETSCHMINEADWPFARAKQEGHRRRMRIEGVFGSIENTGDISSAIIHILLGWNIHYEKVSGERLVSAKACQGVH